MSVKFCQSPFQQYHSKIVFLAVFWVYNQLRQIGSDSYFILQIYCLKQPYPNRVCVRWKFGVIIFAHSILVSGLDGIYVIFLKNIFNHAFHILVNNLISHWMNGINKKSYHLPHYTFWNRRLLLKVISYPQFQGFDLPRHLTVDFSYLDLRHFLLQNHQYLLFHNSPPLIHIDSNEVQHTFYFSTCPLTDFTSFAIFWLLLILFQTLINYLTRIIIQLCPQ